MNIVFSHGFAHGFQVDVELGAGFDAQPSWYGMVIEEIDDEPGQDERLGPGGFPGISWDG